MCDEAEGGCDGLAAVRREFPQSMSEFINRAANAPSGREEYAALSRQKAAADPVIFKNPSETPGTVCGFPKPGKAARVKGKPRCRSP